MSVRAQDTDMRRALKDLFTHLVAKAVRQSKRHDERGNTHADPEYSGDRRHASQPPLLPRPQVTKGEKYFVRHLLAIRHGDGETRRRGELFTASPRLTSSQAGTSSCLQAGSQATGGSDSDDPARSDLPASLSRKSCLRHAG